MEGETATSGVGEGRQQVSHTPAPRSRHIPEDVNGNPVTSDMQLQGPRGGPRLISINRTDQGFGFTLRHFIVYPPELSELLSDDGSASAAVPLSSLDPLDTIFVKHVKLGSPAHLAGLRTGDRVVSVNGEGVGSRSYQEVVATIQRSPPTLHLMVVPRQQDLLQQVFGETAHNPESNLDIRMPSPGLLPLQHPIRHPLTASLTHASLGGSLVQYPPSLSQSTWSSQSSLTSHLSTMSTGHHPPTVMVAHPPFHQKSHQSPKVSQPHGAHIPILPHQQLTIHGNHSSVPYWPGTRKHSLSSGDNQTAVTSSNRKQSLPGMADRRQAVYTIQNSLSSVPHYVPSKSGKPSPLLTSTNLPGSSTHASSNEPSNASVFGIYEPILDRAIGRGKVRDSRRLECDPDGRVYEVVHTRVVESKLNSNGNKKGTVKKGTTGVRNNSGSHHDRKSKVGGEADAKRVRVQSLSPPRLKVDQIHARSASVHPRPERPSVISSSNNVLLHGSHQSLSSTKNEALTRSGNKHNSYSRRSCTEPIISNKENSQTNDKSTQEVIDRIKKNVERKEEFLKRPNQPIWLPASKAPIIHSDYHVNPQRLPRPMWPPPAAQTPPSPGSVTKALSFIVSPKQDQTRKVKPDTEQAQPLDSSASVRGTNVPGSQSSLQNDGKTESSIDPVLPSGNEITNHAEIQNLSSAQSASTVLPRSLVGNAVPKPYSGSTSEANPANARYGKAFVTTLSRIQENIAIPELGSSSSLTSQGLASSKQGDTSQGVTPGGTPSGSETSLNSSIIRPIPLAWVGDNERIKQLQIVSKRAKQFESSQLEKEASCKSAFHRFELSRLSQRSKIPNVAQRKQEFEKRDNDQLPLGFEYEFGTHYNNSPRQRKSAELVRSNLVSQELSPSPAKVFRSLSDGGNVFPVSRRLYSPGHDEGRNSSSVVEESTGLRYGMNRTIPVGGPNIHCTPPSHRPHSDSGKSCRELLAPSPSRRPLLAPSPLQQPLLGPSPLQQPLLGPQPFPAATPGPQPSPAATPGPPALSSSHSWAPSPSRRPLLGPQPSPAATPVPQPSPAATPGPPALASSHSWAPSPLQQPLLAPSPLQQPLLGPQPFPAATPGPPALASSHSWAPSPRQQPLLAPSPLQQPLLGPQPSPAATPGPPALSSSHSWAPSPRQQPLLGPQPSPAATPGPPALASSHSWAPSPLQQPLLGPQPSPAATPGPPALASSHSWPPALASSHSWAPSPRQQPLLGPQPFPAATPGPQPSPAATPGPQPSPAATPGPPALASSHSLAPSPLQQPLLGPQPSPAATPGPPALSSSHSWAPSPRQQPLLGPQPFPAATPGPQPSPAATPGPQPSPAATPGPPALASSHSWAPSPSRQPLLAPSPRQQPLLAPSPRLQPLLGPQPSPAATPGPPALPDSHSWPPALASSHSWPPALASSHSWAPSPRQQPLLGPQPFPAATPGPQPSPAATPGPQPSPAATPGPPALASSHSWAPSPSRQPLLAPALASSHSWPPALASSHSWAPFLASSHSLCTHCAPTHSILCAGPHMQHQVWWAPHTAVSVVDPKHSSRCGGPHSSTMNSAHQPTLIMLSLLNISLDGELAKKQGATNESPGTSTTTTQSYPQPAATTSPTSGHAPRPKRPTFLPIKNHARPALSSNDKRSPIGADKGLEESSHDSLPLCRNSGERAPPCSPHSSLPNSMYQLPAVTTPPAGSGGAGTPGGTSGTSPTTSASVTPTSSDVAMVARRNKTLYGDEGERLVRRVSYLKATSGDRMYSDSDLDSDNDDRSGVRGEGVVRAAGGEAPPEAPTGPVCVRELPSPASLQSAIVRQGALHVKLTMVDGKKAGDRSWKAAWALLQGHAIIFYKDRQHAIQTPLGVEEQISLRGAEVEVASDYTKRRNVLRLATPGGSQLLLQADTPPEMLAWLSTLQNNCALQEGESGSKTPMNNNNVSPQTSNKAMRKLTSTLRTRSPTGQSPSTKTRKPSSSESNSSPKSKTWRGHLKRPFMKKVHSGSPAITPTMPLPEGATIGVCLEDCPPSLENEYVPLLVALCVGVVEGRGLQTQGIYRIPGNKAAVTHLTEMINKDPKSIEYDDPRWCDVNVISSMLKQFFQKLPDPLFTIELYPLFIEASKIEDPSQRMVELKKLVQELPYHHYETLRFLIMHLNNIVSHSDMNKMDVRNLAIVFGPTLVRSGDDNMVTMVTDMSHQCRIVETLISQAAWFFSEDDGEEIVPPVLNHSVLQSPAGESLPPSETDTPSSQALLLHNIQKVEGNIKADMKKDIVSSIISAANRKVHKVKCKKAIEDKPIDDSRHSDKDGGFEERDIDKEAELRKQRLLAKQIESMVELPDPKPMSERKISNMSLMSVQSHSSGVSNFSQSLNNDRTSGSEATKLSIPGDIIHPFCVVKKDGVSTNSAPSTLPTSSTIENTATSTQQSSQLAPETTSLFGDEVAIRSYAGLSASTQERIRRFEMETRAMLHRDLTRHRRETERRDVERQRLEELWQRAKQDMESEDILDQMADNPTEVVRKISDLSWRLQGLRESVDGDRGSLASQSSSPQAALISAALSHHPLSNTSLTPTTNSTTQVPNNYSQPPVIKVVSEPSVGMACDVTNDGKHGMMQQSSLPWLDYNAASPHSTLGSTSSSGSSGYGSLTRSSQASNPCDAEDTIARAVEDICSAEASKTTTKPCTVSQHSSPLNSKKKKSGFLFGLTSSSSSPSLFPSMAEAAAELTPTRKIGQTTIYPESPRPPPHNAHCSSQSQLTVPSTTLIPHPNTPLQGRHKDSILHHILPSRLYHSPRPLRRGSSAENVAQPIVTPLSPSTFDNQMVANNGTLKRARTSRDQILNGPETGMPRCGSLDSLRDGPHIPHDDGSDLLSAITATFEEKMRSLQESHLGLVTAVTDDYISSFDPSSDVGQLHDHTGTTRGKTECRLYRDPSLHRRRTNPRNPSLNASTSSSSSAANAALTSTISQVEAACQAAKFVENENKLLSEEVKCDVKVKRSDSLTKSEKTENNLKEKTEKRARELKRTDTQESLSEKKPKEMKRSDNLDGTERSRDLSKKSEVKDNSVGSTRRTSEVRSRRHNVKELKEKFEQNTSTPSSTNPMKPSTVYSNVNNNSTKTNKSSMRRTGYRGHIKRRHTVGGTKDLAKWAWLQSAEVSRNAPRSTRLSAWERLQPLVADERLNTDRTLEAWLAHERIRTSSPDLSRPQQLVLHCDMDDKENLHRRLSVQEATLNPLYPLLESHV
nr:uncharacterized protein LOC123757768 [Procambarus clarkii]